MPSIGIWAARQGHQEHGGLQESHRAVISEWHCVQHMPYSPSSWLWALPRLANNHHVNCYDSQRTYEYLLCPKNKQVAPWISCQRDVFRKPEDTCEHGFPSWDWVSIELLFIERGIAASLLLTLDEAVEKARHVLSGLFRSGRPAV